MVHDRREGITGSRGWGACVVLTLTRSLEWCMTGMPPLSTHAAPGRLVVFGLGSYR